MGTYKVYKFRGHEYFIPLHLAMENFTGSVFNFWFPFRVQLQGDLYLPVEQTHFEAYVATTLAEALGALYRFTENLLPFNPFPGHSGPPFDSSNFAFYGPPHFQGRVQVNTYVEPTSGDTEIVFRRARLRGDVLFFILSPSAEVEEGEVHLGPLVRPAPRPLVSSEVAATFRKSGDCECQEPGFSAE